MPLWSMLSGLFLCLSMSISAFSLLFWWGLREHWQQDNKQLLSVTPSAVCSVQSVPPFSTRNRWAFSKTVQSSLSSSLHSLLSCPYLLSWNTGTFTWITCSLSQRRKSKIHSFLIVCFLSPFSTLWPKLHAYCHVQDKTAQKLFPFFLSLCIHTLLTLFLILFVHIFWHEICEDSQRNKTKTNHFCLSLCGLRSCSCHCLSVPIFWHKACKQTVQKPLLSLTLSPAALSLSASASEMESLNIQTKAAQNHHDPQTSRVLRQLLLQDEDRLALLGGQQGNLLVGQL